MSDVGWEITEAVASIWEVVEATTTIQWTVMSTLTPPSGAFDGVHNDLDGRSTADAHPISAITGLQAALDAAGGGGAVDSVNGETGVVVLDAASVGAVDVALVGAPDGVAELDSGGLVPSSQLPSYVDDVIEAANFAALPGTGATGKIYVTLDNNLTFRWSGSAYVEISASLALGETSSTAYRGDRGKTAYDHSQVTTGNPHGTTAADIAVDASGFNGNLTTSDDTVQEIAQKVDDLVGSVPTHTIPFVANGWYATNGHAGTSAVYATGAAGRGCFTPVYLEAGSYDRLALQQTVVGTAVWRLALYPSNATTGLPDGESPLVDAGNMDMSTTTGLREITVSATVSTTGWYWAAVKVESRTSDPTVRTFYNLSGVSSLVVPLGTQTASVVDSAAGTYFFARRILGFSAGAFGVCPATTQSDGAVKVLVRRAA